MNILGLQFDVAWENKPGNFAKVHRLLAQAAPEKGALVVLPEMFATGFSMNTELVAEPYGGETEQFLGALAREFEVAVVGGVAARAADGRARNKALFFSPEGKLLGFYAKMRPFTLGGENAAYLAGEQPMVLDWNGCAIAPFICYDLRFPELFRQAAAARQPELFVVLANWPEKRIQHWLRLLQARAIENQAYVVGVNRIGRDPYYEYSGRSLVVDFNGDIIADAGGGEGAFAAHLDLSLLRRYREGLPFLRDISRG